MVLRLEWQHPKPSAVGVDLTIPVKTDVGQDPNHALTWVAECVLDFAACHEHSRPGRLGSLRFQKVDLTLSSRDCVVWVTEPGVRDSPAMVR